MSDLKGKKLFVNLAASETRRRLKGFGHGVRKVQSRGRNRAVVIHTALGHHLHELERKFADVGFSSSEPDERPTASDLMSETFVENPNERLRDYEEETN